MVSEADYADALGDVARWRKIATEEGERARVLFSRVERNSRMHQEAEVVLTEEIGRLRAALQPFADIAEQMRGRRGESPLWAVIDECRAAHAVLNPVKEHSE